MLTENALEEILEYLDKSIANLAKDTFESLELEGGYQGAEDFLQSQFEVRLENLLVAKHSSIHHLESGIKNKIIQRRQIIFDKISRQYRN